MHIQTRELDVQQARRGQSTLPRWGKTQRKNLIFWKSIRKRCHDCSLSVFHDLSHSMVAYRLLSIASNPRAAHGIQGNKELSRYLSYIDVSVEFYNRLLCENRNIIDNIDMVARDSRYLGRKMRESGSTGSTDGHFGGDRNFRNIEADGRDGKKGEMWRCGGGKTVGTRGKRYLGEREERRYCRAVGSNWRNSC